MVVCCASIVPELLWASFLECWSCLSSSPLSCSDSLHLGIFCFLFPDIFGFPYIPWQHFTFQCCPLEIRLLFDVLVFFFLPYFRLFRLRVPPVLTSHSLWVSCCFASLRGHLACLARTTCDMWRRSRVPQVVKREDWERFGPNNEQNGSAKTSTGLQALFDLFLLDFLGGCSSQEIVLLTNH